MDAPQYRQVYQALVINKIVTRHLGWARSTSGLTQVWCMGYRSRSSGGVLDCRMRGLLLRWGGLRPQVRWTAKRQALLPPRCSMQRQQQACANKGDRVGLVLSGAYCRELLPA